MKKLLSFFTGVLLCFTLNGQDLNNGLVLYYPFNGDANDAGPNGLNGMPNGTLTPFPDYYGNANGAYSFNNSYIEIPNVSQHLQLQAYSYSLWVNATTTQDSSLATVLSIGDNPVDQVVVFSPFDGWAGGGFNPGNSPAIVSTRNHTVSTNTWYHLVVTRDASKVQIFVNGQLDSSSTDAAAAPSYGNSPVGYIGRRKGDADPQYFTGAIDDIRIYSRVLSPAEVTLIYEDKPAVINAVASAKLQNSFYIAPNPSNGNFNIAVGDPLPNCSVYVQNSFGETVFSARYSTLAGTSAITLDDTRQGIYFLTVQSDKGTETKKIVVH